MFGVYIPWYAQMGGRWVSMSVSNTYAPAPLPQIKSLGERRETTRAHEGLCGVHNSDSIAGVQLEVVLARGGGSTGTKSRNLVRLNLWACGVIACLRRYLLSSGPSHGLHPIWCDKDHIQRVERLSVLLLLH